MKLKGWIWIMVLSNEGQRAMPIEAHLQRLQKRKKEIQINSNKFKIQKLKFKITIKN